MITSAGDERLRSVLVVGRDRRDPRPSAAWRSIAVADRADEAQAAKAGRVALANKTARMAWKLGDRPTT